MNLNATVLSHGNSLDFGLLGDMHALPDLDIVVKRMPVRFEELRQAVLGTSRSRVGRKAAAPGKKRVAKAKTKTRGKARAKTTTRGGRSGGPAKRKK